jgi:hypothetical protein
MSGASGSTTVLTQQGSAVVHLYAALGGRDACPEETVHGR